MFSEPPVELKPIDQFLSKRKFFNFFNQLSKKEQKDKYLLELEYVNDTFPYGIDDPNRNLVWNYWRKFEDDRKLYYYFHKKPEFINEEVFFNVMNGV